MRLGNLREGYRTQEEDAISNRLLTEPMEVEGRTAAVLYRELLHGRWGLARPEGRRNDFSTHQDVNYVESNNLESYGLACVVRDARMCSSNIDGSLLYEDQFTATLVFSAGPNASNGGTFRGSRQRTRSWSAVHNAYFFEKSIRMSAEATLDAMMADGVTHTHTHAFIARTSCGIYAGPHRNWIQGYFLTIVNEVLAEVIGPNHVTRGHYFQEVIIAATDRYA